MGHRCERPTVVLSENTGVAPVRAKLKLSIFVVSATFAHVECGAYERGDLGVQNLEDRVIIPFVVVLFPWL
jgi:hypothetical protein